VKYPRALKALALLGAEIPAVDLAPLRSSLALNAVVLPPRVQALVYATELKLNEAASPAGREAHHDEAMTMEPDQDGSCPEGYEKGEDGRCHLKKKAMTQAAYLAREFVAEICPSCAEAMRAKKITRLTIARGADGVYDFGVLKQYAGFSEALCEKYGAAEGFRTRCMDSMGGTVDDPGAFCNALKEWCGLMSAKGGEVHTTTESTPMATAATKTPDPQDAPVRDGEIVVRMSEIAELRRKAEKAEKLESLQTNLLAEKAQHEALLEQQRADRLTYKLRDVKLPVFRPYIRALYEIAQGAPSVKQYTVADRQADAEGIVELLVLELNKQAEHLFATLSVVDLKKRDPDEPEDTQGKIAYRVNAYCRAQKLDPRRDYKAAVEAVLAADPDLKRDYAAL
jgi:hypothetical protein